MTFLHQVLSEISHDRHGERRRDEEWLAAQWDAPSSRVLEISGNQARAADGVPVWVEPSRAHDGTRVLLGEIDAAVWWAVLTGSSRARETPEEWSTLRDLLPALTADPSQGAALVMHAMGLAEWHAATRYCPRDGGRLHPGSAGHELRCEDCGRAQFPRTDPAVIMVVTSGDPGTEDERCLLGRSPHWPPGRFSTLAGFYEPGESLEDTVRREVREEAGIEVGEVSYFGNQSWPLPASLMLGFVGRATTTDIRVDAVEIEDARWFTRAEMRDQAQAGTLVLPGGVSISRSLIEDWYGGSLPGHW